MSLSRALAAVEDPQPDTAEAETLLEMYVSARSAGQSDEEALQGVAAGTGDEVELVKEKLTKYVESLAGQEEDEAVRRKLRSYAKLWKGQDREEGSSRSLANSLPAISSHPQPPLVRAPLGMNGSAQRSRSEVRAPSLSPLGGLLADPPSIGNFFTNRGSFGNTGLVRAPQNLVAGAAEEAPESTVAGAGESAAMVETMAKMQETRKKSERTT